MGYKLSFTTQFGLAVAIFFMLKDTFTAGKLIADISPAGGSDHTAGPWNAGSNFLAMLLGVGCLVLYSSLSSTSPIFYFGGIFLYSCGYLVYSCSATIVTWWAAPLAAGDLNIVGGSLFTVGSAAYLYNAWAVAPWRSFEPRLTLVENIFGIQCTWWGALVWLAGSVCYTTAHVMDDRELGDSSLLYQAGILLFVTGRVLFLCPAIMAIKDGSEFVYGGSGAEVQNVAAALGMCMRLYSNLSRVRRDRRERLAKERGERPAISQQQQQLPLDLPTGPWVRKAKMDASGRRGRVTLDAYGCSTLHATVQKDDGTWIEASSPFELLDTFRVHDGELVKGCSAGAAKLTTRDILFMCDLFDEMDFEGAGFLVPSTVQAYVAAMGTSVSRKDVEKLVSDLDLDAGRYTGGTLGLDFPEFLTLLSTSLGGYTCKHEMAKAYEKFDPDGKGYVDPAVLLRVVRDDMHMEDIDADVVAEFMSRYSTARSFGDGAPLMLKGDLVAIFMGCSLDNSRSSAKLGTKQSQPDLVSSERQRSSAIPAKDDTNQSLVLSDHGLRSSVLQRASVTSFQIAEGGDRLLTS